MRIAAVFTGILCTLLLCFFPLAASATESLFEWELSIGADGETTAAAMAVSQYGGVLIAGETNSEALDAGQPYGGYDAYVAYVSEHGEVVWQKRFGGSEDDRFTHIIELSDGGVLAMGSTLSTDEDARNARGGLDVFIAYLTHEGETIWIKCLGGTGDDQMFSIAEADDGSFFVCGRSGSRNGDLPSNKGGWDAWATFLSRENGRPTQRILDGSPADEQFTKITKTSSGWLLLGDVTEYVQSEEANTQVSPFALMLSAEGGEVWEVSLGGQGDNRFNGALATDAGGFVLFGETNSTSVWMPFPKGELDLWVLSLRANGVIAWQWTYGGARDERFHSVIADAFGGYLVLGATRSNDGHVAGAHGSEDLWVISISKGGMFGWQQTLGGSLKSIPAGMLQTVDGGILVAGTTYAQDGDFTPHQSTQTAFLSKLSINGNLEWAELIAPEHEMRLHQIAQSDEMAYLLSTVYNADGASIRVYKINGLSFLR